MNRTSRRLVALVLALVGALVVAGCSTGHNAKGGGRGQYTFVSPGGQRTITYPPQQRQQAPNLHGPGLLHPNQQIHVSDYRGKVVVVNIWGSWCGPCRTEAPELQQLYTSMKGKGVQVLGIDVKETGRDGPKDFAKNEGLTYPSIYSPGGRALLPLHRYPKSVVPSTIVLDRQHRVAAVYLHPVLASDLQPELAKLLSEKA